MRCTIFLLGMLLCATPAKSQKVEYSLRPAAASDEDLSTSLRVTLTLPEGAPGTRTLIFPRAVPMGYSQQPYDRFVSNVRAFDASERPLPVERREGPRWAVGKTGATVRTVEYEVDLHAMESALTSMGDSSRARAGYIFLLGYSIFAFVEGLEEAPVELRAFAPSNRTRWPVFTTLAPQAPPRANLATATAENFYALADSQLVIGPAARIARQTMSFDAALPGVEFFTIALAEGELDFARLEKTSADTFASVARYFGRVPFSSYTVIFEFLKPLTPVHTIGFSMEHLTSATFGLDAATAPNEKSPQPVWTRMAFNIAHHIAHAWIPKRACGENYFPFQWELAPMIDTIWFSEGFGQYAATDALADALPQEQRIAFHERLLDMRFRDTLKAMPAFLKRIPLVELSHTASTLYSVDFRVGRTVFSRGGLMAAEMDALIKEKSQGQKRLRDALRYLVEWSAREKRGFRVEELPEIFQKATGVDTRGVLEKWLAPMPE